MADYKCRNCGNNNHGWCKECKKQVSKSIADCSHYFDKDGTKVRIARAAEDGLGLPQVEISINDQVATFPIVILQDFVRQKNCKSKEFTIPGTK